MGEAYTAWAGLEGHCRNSRRAQREPGRALLRSERPDRVSGRWGCWSAEDGRECYEREEDEQGHFDCARTCN